MTWAIEDMGFEQWKINDLLSEIWLFKSKNDTSKGAVFSYLNSGFGGCISRPLQILCHQSFMAVKEAVSNHKYN